MKKCLFSLMIVCLLSTSAYAYTTRLHKFSSGVKDIVTAPFSLFTVPAEQTRRENHKMLGVLGGLMEGAAQAAYKPVNGAFKILTFPFINHELDE